MFSGARSVQSSIIRGNTRALSSGETFNALVEASVSQTCVKALTTASSWLFKFANCLAHSTISYKISDVVSANYKKMCKPSDGNSNAFGEICAWEAEDMQRKAIAVWGR